MQSAVGQLPLQGQVALLEGDRVIHACCPGRLAPGLPHRLQRPLQHLHSSSGRGLAHCQCRSRGLLGNVWASIVSCSVLCKQLHSSAPLEQPMFSLDMR